MKMQAVWFTSGVCVAVVVCRVCGTAVVAAICNPNDELLLQMPCLAHVRLYHYKNVQNLIDIEKKRRKKTTSAGFEH